MDQDNMLDDFSVDVLGTIDNLPSIRTYPYRKRQIRDQWQGAADPDTMNNAKARRIADQIICKANDVRYTKK
jgi:hypothetical protein